MARLTNFNEFNTYTSILFFDEWLEKFQDIFSFLQLANDFEVLNPGKSNLLFDFVSIKEKLLQSWSSQATNAFKNAEDIALLLILPKLAEGKYIFVNKISQYVEVEKKIKEIQLFLI